MFRNKGTVFPRCHSPSSIQPSLSLRRLRLLVHAEELRSFAFDVAETENKAPARVIRSTDSLRGHIPAALFHREIGERKIGREVVQR